MCESGVKCACIMPDLSNDAGSTKKHPSSRVEIHFETAVSFCRYYLQIIKREFFSFPSHEAPHDILSSAIGAVTCL